MISSGRSSIRDEYNSGQGIVRHQSGRPNLLVQLDGPQDSPSHVRNILRMGLQRVDEVQGRGQGLVGAGKGVVLSRDPLRPPLGDDLVVDNL